MHPARPAGAVPADAVHEATVTAVEDAIRGGGVHTLAVIPYRTAGARCPHDDAETTLTEVGGRTTWYCPTHQRN